MDADIWVCGEARVCCDQWNAHIAKKLVSVDVDAFLPEDSGLSPRNVRYRLERERVSESERECARADADACINSCAFFVCFSPLQSDSPTAFGTQTYQAHMRVNPLDQDSRTHQTTTDDWSVEVTKLCANNDH